MKTLNNFLLFFLLTIPVFGNSFDRDIIISDFKIENGIIHWTTSKEIDNKEFIIEESVDGKTWKSIEHLKGKCYSDINREYRYELHKPSQTTYYRLKSENVEGDIVSYNKILKYEVLKEEAFIRYEIEDQKVLFKTNDGIIKITLLDVAGHEEYKGYIKDGEEIEISKGAHFIKFTSDHQQVFKQVIIE